MVSYGEELFSKKKQETIMVLGCSLVFDELFKTMIEKGTQFTVIVVDTSPSFQGRALLQRLSTYGVNCKYTLINGIGCLIPTTTKVFIDAHYVLGNGGVVGTMGTSMVAYLASQYKVPVIAWCETYKFT
jgi:translation initiation factor eIF-2B subunit delta